MFSRKAKKKKHTYENTKPTKSGRCFLIEPKLFERKSKITQKRSEPEEVKFDEPTKDLCYSIVDITDAVSTMEHFNSIGKSEPDLRKSCNDYEMIQVTPRDCRRGFASAAKIRASEATTKLKRFGANKKTRLQRTFQSLTNLCVTNLRSCEDLTKGKDVTKCDYSRLTSPSARLGRSVGNIYDTLSRQNPWKLARGPTCKYDDIEVHVGNDNMSWTRDERRRYQSISIPRLFPETGQYSDGRLPLAGLEGYKAPQWHLNKLACDSDYEHVQLNRPVIQIREENGPTSTLQSQDISPVYFTLDPSNRQSHRNHVCIL